MEGNTQVEKAVLAHLDAQGEVADSDQLPQAINFPKDQIESVLKSLAAEEYISLSVIERKNIELTEEG